MKADLHIHSRYSQDAISSPESICRAALRKGLDAIALTDHGTTAGWAAMRRTALEAGLIFIPGQEQKVVQRGRVVGEVLCLFLTRPVLSYDLPGILYEVRAQGGWVAAAHPFDLRRPALGDSALLSLFNSIGIEVLNGRSYRVQVNDRAAAYASSHHSPTVAGSDAHTPFEVGNVYVEGEAETAEDLRREIMNRRVKICGRVSHPFYSLVSGIRKLDCLTFGSLSIHTVFDRGFRRQPKAASDPNIPRKAKERVWRSRATP